MDPFNPHTPGTGRRGDYYQPPTTEDPPLPPRPEQRTHLRLGAGLEPEPTQDVQQRQLDLQQPQPHPEAAPGARPERQVGEGTLSSPRLGLEPAGAERSGWARDTRLPSRGLVSRPLWPREPFIWGHVPSTWA